MNVQWFAKPAWQKGQHDAFRTQVAYGLSGGYYLSLDNKPPDRDYPLELTITALDGTKREVRGGRTRFFSIQDCKEYLETVERIE